MALKSDRSTLQTDISFFMNEAATRGGVASISTGGSGVSLDNGAAVVTYGAVPSGKVPVGVLLNDMVNIDLTRQHLNQHKDEVQKGGKVTILTRGWVVTNNIEGTPKAGEKAYAVGEGVGSATAGALTNATLLPGASGALCVGRWMSCKDADGYAKLYVNLPHNA